MLSSRRCRPLLVLFGCAALTASAGGTDVVPGTNVNMVGGPVKFKVDPPHPVAVEEGDPFLQRQNEPSCAVMTRNPLKIFCGANDYRTVDLPGLPEHKLTRDAWLGQFWSVDGGETWRNRLLPGFPQDSSPQGLASPIHGLQAGADATVRAGVGDIIYYSGIAFNREALNSSTSGVEGKKGALFVARFNHPNLPNDPEPFRYLDTQVVDNGSNGRFLDKPWLAVDSARGTATCTVQVPGANAQTIPAGNVYLGYSVFVGNNDNRTKIMLTRSTDCGATWSHPTKLSEGYPINQGVSIAIDPRTGWVYVAWRRLAALKETDAILYAVSKDGGATFSKAMEVASLPPLALPDGSTLSPLFDQAATTISIRTVAFPHLAVGDSGVDGTPGPVYATWSQRWPQQQGGVAIRDARAVLSVGAPSAIGTTWSAPAPIHDPPEVRGHQIQPTAEVAGGKLNIAYLHLQDDHTAGVFTRVDDVGPDGIAGTDDDALLYSETREAAGDLPGEPEKVFTDFLVDRARADDGRFIVPLKRRHTIDTWLSQADLTSSGTLGSGGPHWRTVRVSRYPFGKKVYNTAGHKRLEQLQYSPPNYRLFSLGNAAFIGDYIDIGRPLFRRAANGGFVHDTAKEAGGSPPLYVTWTDNRDVRPPVNGDWTTYTPIVYPELGGQSVFDPTQMQPVCDPARSSRTGMRNQNVYAARITEGLFVSSLTNQKPLSHATFTDDGVTFTVDEHVFPVTIKNETDQTKWFRVVLGPDPTAPDPTAEASFDQFSTLTRLDLKILRRSSVSRNAFVRASSRQASIKVSVFEIDGLGAPDPTADGLQAFTILNPDPTAPDPTAPDPTAPDPTATEVYTVDLASPDPTATGVDVTNEQVLSPDPTAPDPTAVVVKFPDPTAPDPTAPDPTAPDPTAPDPTAFDVANPDVTAPDPTAPDPTANALTDTVFRATNTGDNAAAYKVKLFLKKQPPPGFRLQLILNGFYATPAAVGCQPGTNENPVIIANLPDPAFVTTTADLANPDPTATGPEDASFTLGPGQEGFITVRIFDPNRLDNLTFTDPVTGRTITIDPAFNPAEDVEAAVIPPVDNVDAAQGITHSRLATSFLFINTTALPSARTGEPYSAVLQASGGVTPLAWSVVAGALPAGLTLDPATGAITGTPGTAGTFAFTIQAQDSSASPQTDLRALSITVVQSGVASLAFVQQPTDALSGATLAPPVSVRAVNPSGAAVAGVPVQVAIGTNPGGGTLSGTTAVLTGSNGVAVFTNLAIDAPGIGYTLVATAPAGFAAATSVPFRIMSPAPVAMTFTVTNTDDAGPGSLRQALLDANTNVGQSDTILFAIPGTGPHTISPSSEPLPAITDPVLIDAPDTGDCSGGAPTVHLDGALLEGGAGLAVSTTGATIRGLAITRFLGPGILLSGGGSNVIECSYLGLAPDGVTVAGNTVGIRVINSSNNTVGGTSTAVRNVISGNTRGVEVLGQVGPASGNLIQGNFIGTDASGALDRGNAQNGVHVIDAANNTVGGAPAARNVVSGNGGEGVRIDGALATGNLVQGNYIGTNAAGTGDVGNSASGVYIRRAPGNSVVLNVVSGNDGFAGVAVCGRLSFCGGGDLGTQGSNASGNGIHSNLIGTTADQSSPLGNNGHGVSIDGAVNTVVGGNLITASGAQGVVIFGAGATANQVAANNVHSNAGLGIDLGDADAADGVTPNDPGDGDAGPNGLQNFPVLTSATSAPGVTTVEGSLNSAPNTAFTIDFFFSGACDPSGNGEGFQFMGSHSQSTNADGNLSFRAIFNASLSAPGTVVTAVATSPVDGSSEFSACVTVAPPGAFTFTVTNTDDNGPGSLRQALLDANGNENPAFTDTILFAIPGDPPHTIALLSPLPGIGEPVLIDAPPTGDCNGTPPTVEIDGNAAGPATHGLFVDTGGVTIRGLALTRFSLSGIFFAAAGSNVVECSYLGLAPDGVTAKGNIDGVLISGSSNNTVGGTTAAVRNVISGNRAAGVRIAGSNLTNGNQVLGNYIGTNADGTAAVGNGTSGVQVEQPSNTVRGNLISGNQAGVTIENGATNVVVAANLIGTNGAGTAAIPNTTVGVLVSGRPDNHIGGAGAGEGNLLSGNASHGVWLLGSTASNNTIRGNRIGTNAAGDAVLANGGRGVLVTGGSANTIGGSAAGAGNLISGNDGGVELIGTAGTIVQGNRIGTDALGAVALGNGPVGSGVSLDGAQTATIGGTSAGARNLISGNFRGVQCTNGSSGNVFQGNYVGTTADGSTALGNSSAGMVLSSCPSNTIGGTAAGAGNVISGNTSFGVWIATAGDNVLQGNLIGTNAAGTAAVPNTSTGLVLTPGATTTIIGGTEPGAGNVISGNGESGLEFNGASGNSAQGNVIGLASSGSATLPNAGEGIRIANGATGNTIGGTTAAARNIISGNLLNGVQITGFGDSGTSANLVQGNYIGTDRDGTAALGNGLSGIRVSRATNNIIGSGPDGPAGNLISGNTDGVWIDGPTSSGNQVQGNLIGTDASGTAAVGNTAAGVRVDGGAQSTSIGGNIVSGNGGDGIVVGPTTGTSVSGNLIGTTNFATAALGNGGHGVLLSVGAAATIGGDSIENFRNIISANGGNGIRILANGILVRGNRIGADPSGSPGFGNRLAGVAIEQGAANNTIGGTDTGAARNFIAFNGEAGIRAGDAGPGNSFRFNNIDANGGLGIDLGALGVTPNDASDGDRGPNDLQNFPVLTSATSVSGTTTIQGTLNSTANTDFVIDFFDNPACDPSLNGEGLIWFGSHTQSSDASGNLSFTAGFAGGPAEGTFVTAIATSADGSTSEFSACVLVPTP